MTAVNELGLIVGDVRAIRSTQAAIFHAPNNVTFLGTLGRTMSSAGDVNNLGAIVGMSLTGAPYVPGATDAPALEAFVYYEGTMRGIGTLGGNTSIASAINDTGVIVGESSLPNGEFHAFAYDAVRGMIDLGAAGQQSGALRINEAGQIVGYVVRDTGLLGAALFTAGGSPQLLENLVLGGSGWERLIRATDINNRGQIVGTGIINGD